MQAHGIVGISGIDTRALVRHLRTHGAQEAIISTVDLDSDRLVARAKARPGLVGRDLVSEVTCAEAYDWNEPLWRLEGPSIGAATGAANDGPFVVAYDYGIKYNILRNLVSAGCRVRVVPRRRPRKTCSPRSPTASSSRTAPATPTRCRTRATTSPG
jgi:carbamoyl-phosphate synthase small subunit